MICEMAFGVDGSFRLYSNELGHLVRERGPRRAFDGRFDGRLILGFPGLRSWSLPTEQLELNFGFAEAYNSIPLLESAIVTIG